MKKELSVKKERKVKVWPLSDDYAAKVIVLAIAIIKNLWQNVKNC